MGGPRFNKSLPIKAFNQPSPRTPHRARLCVFGGHPALGRHLALALVELDAAFRREVDHRQQESPSVQRNYGRRDAEGGVALAREGAVPDLGGLEGDDHVGGGTEHGQVAGDGGREGNLHPVVGRCEGEGGGEHLDHGDVGSDVGEDGDDEDEPVDARDGGHLVGATAHGEVEEGLGDAGVVEGADEDELPDEEHEEAVVDLRERGLGLGDELLLLRLDLVPVHVVHLLGGEGVPLGVVLDHLRLGVVVLPLPRGEDHQDRAGADGRDAHVETDAEADEERRGDEDLDLGPYAPSPLDLFVVHLGDVAGVVGVLLREHLRGAISAEDDAAALEQPRGAGEELPAVVHEEHDEIDDRRRRDGQDHVGEELRPRDVVIGEGHDEDVLGVARHGEGAAGVGGGGEG